MRTRILPKMLNSEVEEYLQHNDIIIVPVGTVEMHGGFPLDSETVISEAFALKMAEACDGLLERARATTARLVGGDPENTKRMGLGRADTVADALQMAKDIVGPNPSTTYMHIPPLFICEVS